MPSSHTDVLLAGAFAAFSVDLIVYPLDTLKTRYQSPDYVKLYCNASRTAINRGALFSGLYQGVGSIILITIPSSGAFFTTYEAVKSGLSQANKSLFGSRVPEPFVHSTASAIAELVSCAILTPAEVLKQNAQMIQRPTHEKKGGLGTSVTLQALRRFDRPSQLWRGYMALAGRNLPFTAMQFPMFERLKLLLTERRKRQDLYTGGLLETGIITAISAGSAGSVAAVITTPIDVIKTRIMLAAANEGRETATTHHARQSTGSPSAREATSKIQRKSSLTIAKEVYAEAGMKGLFRGGILRAVWTALGSGLYLGVYEAGKSWLGADRPDQDQVM